MIEADRIYCEDCLETLRKIEDNSVNLIITSPPYNKGYWSKRMDRTRYKYKDANWKKANIDYDELNDCLSPEDYADWQKQIIGECLRVLTPDGSMWYNHCDIQSGLRTIHPTYIYEFPLYETIIWERSGTNKIDKHYLYPTCEWLFWLKKQDGMTPYFDRDQLDPQYRSMVWRITQERNTPHPAPFPYLLPENIIKCCSKEGDLIYDPFMGSGTTALAARNLGRHYIGSEISEKYVAMANERLGLM